MITVSFEDNGAIVNLYVDDLGIDELVETLTQMRGKFEHEHLMTSSWGGVGLDDFTEKPGGVEKAIQCINIRANHL